MVSIIHRSQARLFRSLRMLYNLCENPTVVIDTSYATEMYPMEMDRSVREVANCIRSNMVHRTPMNIYLSSLRLDSDYWRSHLSRVKGFSDHSFCLDYPTISHAGDCDDDNSFDWLGDAVSFHILPDHFTKYFDGDRLVYLSPDATEELTEVRPDDVYVIGALVDKFRSDNFGESLMAARKYNIRAVKLPISGRLHLLRGRKMFHVSDAFRVLLEANACHNDWDTAFDLVMHYKPDVPPPPPVLEDLYEKWRREDCEKLNHSWFDNLKPAGWQVKMARGWS